MARYYCGLLGGVVRDDQATGKCPECWRPLAKHRVVEGDACGCFAPCPEGDHGHPCVLAPGHAGSHSAPSCASNPTTSGNKS